MCPDTGGGRQVPKCQGLGQTPRDQAPLIGEQLAGEDTAVTVLLEGPTFSNGLQEAWALSVRTEVIPSSPSLLEDPLPGS